MSKNEKTCPKCGGSGSVHRPCGACNAKGCTVCGKSGWVWEECDDCNGRGKVPA